MVATTSYSTPNGVLGRVVWGGRRGREGKGRGKGRGREGEERGGEGKGGGEEIANVLLQHTGTDSVE